MLKARPRRQSVAAPPSNDVLRDADRARQARPGTARARRDSWTYLGKSAQGKNQTAAGGKCESTTAKGRGPNQYSNVAPDSALQYRLGSFTASNGHLNRPPSASSVVSQGLSAITPAINDDCDADDDVETGVRMIYSPRHGRNVLGAASVAGACSRPGSPFDPGPGVPAGTTAARGSAAAQTRALLFGLPSSSGPGRSGTADSDGHSHDQEHSHDHTHGHGRGSIPLSASSASFSAATAQHSTRLSAERQARAALRRHVGSSAFNGQSGSEFYLLGKEIGQGSFGVVRLGWHRLAGARVAVKVYDKARLADPDLGRRVAQEELLMARLNHPHIVRLLETCDTPKRLLLVMEHGGDQTLCAHVKARGRLPEHEARRIFLQLLSALEHMHHAHNIIHRDVKLENVLLSSQPHSAGAVGGASDSGPSGGSGSGPVAKLVDLGFAVHVRDPRKRLKTYCGTQAYMAPELAARREYLGPDIDAWALAVLLYACLTGTFPFPKGPAEHAARHGGGGDGGGGTYGHATNTSVLCTGPGSGALRFPEYVSGPARDLLRRMLHPDPASRLRLGDARSHPWLAPTVASQPHLQLHSSPSDRSLLVSADPHRDLTEIGLRKMEERGFRRSKVVAAVLGRERNAITAVYYLLLARVGRRAGPPPQRLSTPEQTAPVQAPVVPVPVACSRGVVSSTLAVAPGHSRHASAPATTTTTGEPVTPGRGPAFRDATAGASPASTAALKPAPAVIPPHAPPLSLAARRSSLASSIGSNGGGSPADTPASDGRHTSATTKLGSPTLTSPGRNVTGAGPVLGSPMASPAPPALTPALLLSQLMKADAAGEAAKKLPGYMRPRRWSEASDGALARATRRFREEEAGEARGTAPAGTSPAHASVTPAASRGAASAGRTRAPSAVAASSRPAAKSTTAAMASSAFTGTGNTRRDDAIAAISAGRHAHEPRRVLRAEPATAASGPGSAGSGSPTKGGHGPGRPRSAAPVRRPSGGAFTGTMCTASGAAGQLPPRARRLSMGS